MSIQTPSHSIGGPAIDFFLARQPIFDREFNLFGYELLFRSSLENRAEFSDPDEATTQVILNAFTELPIEKIIGPYKPFINLTRNFLLGKKPIPFTPQQVVMEVPETIQSDPSIYAPLQALAQRGYQLALDDVSDPKAIVPLLGLAQYIKVDLIEMGIERVPAAVRFLHRYPALLLAEKVETRAEFELCKRLGFHYFQGYFLSKPSLVQGRKVPATRLVILQLIGQLQNPAISFRELESIVAQDATLSYKILKLINSSFYGLSIEVKSISQAIAILGLEQLSNWAVLFLVSSTRGKPKELSRQAMLRAKMCEQMAAAAGEPARASYFLAGLFSMLDSVLDMPMERILESVPLSKEIVEAILRGSGRIGQALHCVRAYERGDWPNVYFGSLSPGAIGKAYLDSLQWADQFTQVAHL